MLPYALSFIIIIVFLVVFLVKQYQRKHRKPFDVSKLDQSKPFVLFLRSFNSDGSGTDFSRALPFTSFFDFNILTFEEQILVPLKKIGPCIAIGRPGEKLPEMGADRTYVNDEQWQETVAGYLEKCSLIIMRPSETEGLFWEFQHIFDKKYLNKLIIFRQIGNDESFEAQRSKYAEFSQKVQEKTGLILPAFNLIKQYIYFNDDNSTDVVFHVSGVPFYKKLVEAKTQ